MKVCGVDEAGRGPLAGPVFAAAVILDECKPIVGLKDSKLLTPERRAALEPVIKQSALAWSIASASVEEIDRLNILRATMLAMERAVAGLPIIPDEAWVDGNCAPKPGIPVRTIVKGDRLHPCISAASILAKTARDAEMGRLHLLYPQYGLDRHKGYPTAAHLEALRLHGACEIYRRSFRPVREARR